MEQHLFLHFTFSKVGLRFVASIYEIKSVMLRFVKKVYESSFYAFLFSSWPTPAIKTIRLMTTAQTNKKYMT